MNILDIKSKEMSQLACRRISRLRKSAGMSLEDFAAKTGLSGSYLSEVENCMQEPTLRSMIKIAGAFGLDVMFLISGVDKP